MLPFPNQPQTQTRGMTKMGMTGNTSPFGQPFSQTGGQQIEAPRVNPQLPSKQNMVNSLPPFPTDIKNASVTNVSSMSPMQSTMGILPIQVIAAGPTADPEKRKLILGSPACGIPSTIGSVSTGQQNATSLSNPNPIDVSSMLWAYAVLGLPFPNQPQAQLQPRVPGQQPAQPPAHQQMRTLNPMGNNTMNIPTGGMITDQQPPNLLSQSALLTSLGAANPLIPVPSSVASADTSSQQLGSEVSMQEMKSKIKTYDTEPDVSEPQGKSGSEMTDEDIQRSSHVKETGTIKQESEPMEVDEKKPEVKTEAKEEEESGPNGAASQSTSPAQPRKKIFKPEELRQALMPSLEALYGQDSEFLPFRKPMDPELLGIPHYLGIDKNPMDLSTIKRKLETGQYQEPWQYVDDFWLLFNNTWRHKRKNSRVYKFCSRLADLFEQEIDPVMQSLGYCCGKKYEFSSQTLCCYGKQLCKIPPDAAYYSYQNRYNFCQKCFRNIRGENVSLGEDPSQPQAIISKDLFEKKKNDRQDPEPFVDCKECGRKMHQICVLHHDIIWPSGFVCDNCLKKTGTMREENQFSAKRLQTTRLGSHLEERVNKFLRQQNHPDVGEVFVRVVATSNKRVEVKPGMKSRFVDSGEMSESFPYRTKALFAFEEIDGVDVCFFAMYVQEYGSDCPPPNTRRVYISYLDSVHYFQPRCLRTAVYHELLMGYLEYAKNLGYVTGHIWSCPPQKGDDYIFHCHPPDQKIPKPKRLQEWYKKMLDKAVADHIIHDYKDIFKQATEDGLTSAKELPYFSGDFWPKVLEESIKELEQEDDKRKKEKSTEASEPTEGSQENSKNAEKKKRRKRKKTKSSISRANKKSRMLCDTKNLSQKLYAMMEKQKENFFVIHLHAGPVINTLPPIVDPDPLLSCDLMDGRDAFLTLATNKHWEFSSLRRSKWSTLCMLVELHTQGQDHVIYSCNECKHQVETCSQCTVCEDYKLCYNCYNTKSHTHKIAKCGLGPDDEVSNQGVPQSKSPEDSRSQNIQHGIQLLVHACQCLKTTCSLLSCQKMKHLLQHAKGCNPKTNRGCPVCKQFSVLCCCHAKHCKVNKCPVPICLNIKHKLHQQQTLHHMQQAQLMHWQKSTMNTSSMPQQSLPSSTSATPGTTTQQPSMPQILQPPAQPQPSPVSMSPSGLPSIAQTQPPTIVYAGKPTNQVPAPLQPAQPSRAAVEAARQIEHEAQQQQHLYKVNIKNDMSPGHPGVVVPVSQMAAVGLSVPCPSQVSRPIMPIMPPGQWQQVPFPQQQPMSGMPRPVMAMQVSVTGPPMSSVPPPRSISPGALQDLPSRSLRSPQPMAKYVASHPGLQSQHGLLPQPGLHQELGSQNLNVQAGGPWPVVPPQNQAMGSLNPQRQALNIMNPGHNPSMASMNPQYREMLRCQLLQQQQQQQQQQQPPLPPPGSTGMARGMAAHGQFQQRQGSGGYSKAMQPQWLQQHLPMQGGAMGQMADQMGQLGQMGQPELGADSTASFQEALQQQMKQQIGSPGQPNPRSPQQHMLSGQPQALYLPGQQMATSLSSQVQSPALVLSPRPTPNHHIPAHNHGYRPSLRHSTSHHRMAPLTQDLRSPWPAP